MIIFNWNSIFNVQMKNYSKVEGLFEIMSMIKINLIKDVFLNSNIKAI